MSSTGFRHGYAIGLLTSLLFAGQALAGNYCTYPIPGVCQTQEATVLATGNAQASTVEVGHQYYYWDQWLSSGSDGPLSVGNRTLFRYIYITPYADTFRIRVHNGSSLLMDCSTGGEPGTTAVQYTTYDGWPTYFCGDSETGAAIQLKGIE